MRAATGRVRGALGAVVLLLASVVLAACNDDSGADRPAEQLLPKLERQFVEQRPTWAQAETIHYGDEEITVDGGAVRDLHPTPYGFVVGTTAPGADGDRWAVVDRSGTHPLPGDVSSVAVSREGSYLGYVDRDGPLSVAGRVAEVVVVDLRDGEVVGRTSEGMGGGPGDDLGVLYSEDPPVALGFDGSLAYYQGSGDTHEWDLETGRTRVLPPGEEVQGFARPPWREGLGYLQPYGFTSADDRFRVNTSTRGRVVVRARSGGGPAGGPDGGWRRVDLDTGHRYGFFGHTLGTDRAVLLTLDRYRGFYSLDAPDRSRGHLTVCRLATGSCRDIGEVVGTWSVRFPAGPATSWGEF